MSENFAVYFDCENVSAIFVEYVFEKLEKIKGKRLLIKRAFRDWGKSNCWDKKLAEKHGLQAMQVFANNLKNGADIAITIDVMKELRNGVLQGIALVSSDSDFSHLATEIRANGLEVFIFGDSDKANERLKNSCDKFFPFPKAPQKPAAKANEPLQKSAQKASEKSAQTPKNASLAPATKSDDEIKDILKEAIKKLESKLDSNGFCNGATIGTHLRSQGLSLADFGEMRYKNLFERFPDLFECKLTGKENSTLKIRLK